MPFNSKRVSSRLTVALAAFVATIAAPLQAKTVKPPLHGQHWVAVTGKPLAATAGARIFMQEATRSTRRAR